MARTPDDPTKAQVWIDNTDPLNPKFEFYFPRGSKGDPGGIVNPNNIGAGYDWNNLIVSGLYFAAGADMAGQPNSPPSMAVGVDIMVIARNSSVVTQIAWTTSNAHNQIQFMRSLVSGVWSPWKVFRNTSIDNTLGRTLSVWDETNNRSQLMYGDTGWRDISVAGETQKTLLRRVGHVVEVQFTNHTSPGGNYAFPNSVPVGFRPAITREYPFREGAAAYGSTKMVSITNNGTITFWNSAAGTVSVAFVYTTTESWPAVLPGSATGNIPNL
ncbi:hypothetical protein SEA_ROZBY_2 [Arthrobacter phage Rozby]|uniref:Minor tail protein n=2 Tax=Korravirus glenn TaxID=1982079 RepID=A0A3S9UHD3_9CAUD|nr:hypothetical protein SEA_VALLEJO_2 [Arthrobacter phage Vallejo]AZS09755.1 hypothetical protein SEA_ROZBY_2 [Arthrobacter phage Rozby]